MLSESGLRILASFFPDLKDRTAKEIETYTGLSHEPTFRILKSLVKEKYLKEKKIGKTNVYEFILTDETYLVYTYFMTKKVNKFKEKHHLLYKRLKEFINSIDILSAILFGSYARGTETEKSDIDVLVVSEKKDIEKIASTFRTKYGILINPAVVKPQDFNNIKRDNPVFYKDLVDFGIILDGIEFFFKRVYKNAKTD